MAHTLGRLMIVWLLPLVALAEMSLKCELSKNRIHINEVIQATVTFHYTHDEMLDEIEEVELSAYDFIVQALRKSATSAAEGSTTVRYEFLLQPKTVGGFTIPPQRIQVSSETIRKTLRRQKIFSNEQKVEVLPPFQNLFLQGDYTIQTSVDQQHIQSNTPLNLTIWITGHGNIQEIPPFDLGLKNQLVFSDTPKINSLFNGTTYEGNFTQKLSILADKSFTIPSLSLRYYDIKQDRVKTSSSQPIFIEVESDATQQGDSYVLKYLFGAMGIALGGLAPYVYRWLRLQRQRCDSPLIVQIRKAKTDKALYDLLLPYAKEHTLLETMNALEENLYQHAQNSIDKKALIAKVCTQLAGRLRHPTCFD